MSLELDRVLQSRIKAGINVIPRTEHILEVVELAYFDESIVSQKGLGALGIWGNGVSDFHADCIGLRKVVTRTYDRSKWERLTFPAAAVADSSSIQDIDESDFLKAFTISAQHEFENTYNSQSRTSNHFGALLLGVTRESLIHKVSPSCEPESLVHTINTVLRAIADGPWLYAL